MKKLLAKISRAKRGSEIIQTLIVIAITGALAVAIIGGIASALSNKATEVTNGITSLNTTI